MDDVDVITEASGTTLKVIFQAVCPLIPFLNLPYQMEMLHYSTSEHITELPQSTLFLNPTSKDKSINIDLPKEWSDASVVIYYALGQKHSQWILKPRV